MKRSGIQRRIGFFFTRSFVDSRNSVAVVVTFRLVVLIVDKMEYLADFCGDDDISEESEAVEVTALAAIMTKDVVIKVVIRVMFCQVFLVHNTTVPQKKSYT